MNDGRFEINQLSFADDTVLVADSEQKLCRLVTEFGRVCERSKLRVNVEVLKACKWGSVRGSRVFQVPGIASDSRWICKRGGA